MVFDTNLCIFVCMSVLIITVIIFCDFVRASSRTRMNCTLLHLSVKVIYPASY